jgi:3'(2'), 5'-bisphosphate nucleotidase
MSEINVKNIVESLIETFLDAGDISINLRKKGLSKKIKLDNTPVSNGDLEVNRIITNKIKELTPNIPVVSEETSDNKSNNNLENFWLVDPIDGTHDYINNLEEFTINAGLILDKKPAAGLIYAPAKKRMFYSYGEDLSFEFTNGKTTKLEGSKKFNENQIKFVSYSNKIKPEIQNVYQKLNVKNHIKMKSSLKFCVIAAGEFDGYVAEPRACEWDIAAGHAILKHSGGSVTDFNNDEITYGKKDFKNPSLILKSKHLLQWMNN